MKTHLEEKKLFGKVLLIATQTQDEYQNYYLDSYNKDGYLNESIKFAKEEFPDKTFILVDKMQTFYTYDFTGRILSTYSSSNDGYYSRENYLYEDNTRTSTDFYGDKQLGGSKSVYDQNGLLLEEYFFMDNEQDLYIKIINEYKNGRVIRSLEFSNDVDLLLVGETLYDYDEHGNVSHETEIILGGSSEERRIDSYYTYGNMTHKTVIERSGSADEKKMEFRYTYTFDSHGNWLTKTKHGETEKITQRRITYWD